MSHAWRGSKSPHPAARPPRTSRAVTWLRIPFCLERRAGPPRGGSTSGPTSRGGLAARCGDFSPRHASDPSARYASRASMSRTALRARRGSRGRVSGGLRGEGPHDVGRHVPAATAVGDEGGDGPDGAPGNAPPAAQERNEGVGGALAERALVPLDELDVGDPLEGEDDDRDAVLEDHEPAASLDLVTQLVRRQGLDPLDLHSDNSAASRPVPLMPRPGPDRRTP